MSLEYPDALPVGYRLEEYEVVRVLGKGGFAITYLANDSYRDQQVALKEYFPAGYAIRTGGTRVDPAPGAREVFDWGYRRFLDEARILQKFRHPNIPAVYRYFRANGTAYIGMEYVRGPSLSEWLGPHGSLALGEWRRWLDRLLDALEHVHSHHYLHRDITPSNILIRESDDQPVLIDFGAARIAADERTRTVVLTEAYAPPEQRSKRAKQDPFTDIYSIAAVSYRVLTGDLPASAMDRTAGEEHQPLAQRFEEAADWMATVDRALALRPKKRPQTVDAWRKELNEAAAKMWMRDEPVQSRDTEGLTALHRAAAGEPLPEVVGLLLDEGADIHAAAGSGDDDFLATGETPLHRAAAANPNPAVTALLLDRGASIHAKAIDGESVLHLAAEQNSNAAVAGVLQDRGADAGSRDSSGMTPLHLAAKADRRDVVDSLLDRGSYVDELAFVSWNRALLRFARSNRKDTSKCSGTTPLHTAAEGNAIGVTSLLIDHGADVNARDHSGKTPLHLAAQRNALDVMELLTESGANPWATDLVGRTPLHTASWGNAHGAVQSLLRRGTGHPSDDDRCRTQFWIWNDRESAEQLVEVLAEDKWLPRGWTDLRPVAEMLMHAGNTPLHWAAFGDSREVAELLLDEGADVHGGKSEGPTPLDFAALGNATGTARLLLDRGADARGRDDYPATPLHWAALGNACETMALLIDRGADAGARRPRWTPMLFAALGNARQAMELLLAHGAELGPQNTSGSVVSSLAADWKEAREGFAARVCESDTDTLLHWASVRNATDVLEMLLDRGLDIEAEDADGRTPLERAAQGNADNAVERLLDRGANISGSRRTCHTSLHSACSADAFGTARLLVERGADLQAGQSDIGTPLHMTRSTEIASVLLESGANVSARDSNGRTPLHSAATNRDVAKLLIDRDADIEATDRDGDTPLHHAVSQYASGVAELLLSRGAEINRTNSKGDTPLHIAAGSTEDDGWKTTVLCLLRRGADVGAVNADGKTPLIVAMAVERDWEGVARDVLASLVDHGADIEARDLQGNTPLHAAASYRNPTVSGEITSLLLERGADVGSRDDRGRTALHVAAELARSRYDRGIGSLVSAEAEGWERGWRSRFDGKWGGNQLLTVQTLIDGNADIHAQDDAGRTPLEMLRNLVTVTDSAGIYSESIESLRIHSRDSVRLLFSES